MKGFRLSCVAYRLAAALAVAVAVGLCGAKQLAPTVLAQFSMHLSVGLTNSS